MNQRSLLFSVILSSLTVVALPAQAQYSGLGKDSLDPAILKRYAPTALPPNVTRPIESILDVRSPGLGMVTPDGKRMFFTWGITGTVQVWRLDGAQKFPVQVTGGQDATTIAGMTPDGKYLILSRDRQGEENPGLYLQSTNGGELEVIQHLAGVRTSLQYIGNDSRTIYFSANDVKPDSNTIYRYDLQTKKKVPISGGDGIWWIADVYVNPKTGDREKFLFAKATGSQSQEYYEYDVKTRTTTPLIGQNEKEEYGIQYGVNADEYLVLTPKFSEFRRLYSYKNKQFTPITPELKADVASFDIDDQRQRILYSINDGGYTRVKAIAANNYEAIDLPEFANADHIYTGNTTRNGRFTTIGVETAKAPRLSYVYDWQTKKLTQWVLPSTPEVDTSKFTAAKLETYTTRDGTKIPMFVYRSPQCENTPQNPLEKPCPVIVHFHGGPEGQSTAGFNRYAQLFVNAGFVFAEPNVRGSEGYGKTWLNADNGRDRLKVITDIEDASIYIRKNWQVNGITPKIGIVGGSYGGYSALIGMSKFAGSYDAGVSIVGISNLLTFLNNTAPYRRILRISEYGDPVKDRDALIELSPVTYSDRIKAPLLIIQGANDPRVPVGEAIQIQKILEQKKIPSQLVIFPDEGHGSSKRSNQVLEIGYTLDFFKKHLQN
ncbi:prolyl oligopeptidase family serine peptidase [Pseudanabaena sp. ABRG5-3]|uniref:S9 family peptidase n=1 Tax=Pseudanabaena sp. ABRG5-3 TaxID=685565 RepID=UPI000DC71576|nr:prolyl oligopeptidase family serine peptidase [Pseudanabaena sp. ABRG5-3]BBC25494.1 peptidase S9 prolyl oligopeptidase active site domain protein [Pseudanabaena sp. ABRG5-3]